MRRVSFIALTCIAALFPLSACELSPTRLTDNELREAYHFEVAYGADTLTFASFAAPYRESALGDSVARKLQRALRVIASTTLGELGYGTGPFRSEFSDREKGALRRFQADLRLPVTGTLDSLSIMHIVKAQKALALSDIVLPDFYFSATRLSLSACGTWRADAGDLGYPINTVDIECSKVTGVCEVVRVEVISDDLSQLGRIRRNTFNVLRWDEEMIVAGEDWENGNGHVRLTAHIPTKDIELRQWSTVNTSQSPYDRSINYTLKLVGGMRLAPPFDGGDLKEVHEKLYKDRDRYLALKLKNSEIQDIGR